MSKNIDPSSQIESSSTVSVGSTPTTLLVASENRRTVVLQNLSTSAVYVHLGDACTTSLFTFILPAGTLASDGTGGVFTEDVLSYTGIITATVATGSANVRATAL